MSTPGPTAKAPTTTTPTDAATPAKGTGGDSKKDKEIKWNRIIIIGASAAAVVLAVGIPLIINCCQKDEDEEKKDAIAGKLNKLVSWVKEVSNNEIVGEDQPANLNQKYIETDNVADFAKTQSL